MTSLGDFLRENGRRPRAPGEWDCCTFPSAWAVSLGFPDPMARHRGTYATDDRAEKIIAAEGGLVALFGEGLDPHFARRQTGEAQPGDIGVLRLLGLEVGSVYTGKRWAIVLDRGLGFHMAEPGQVAVVWGSGQWAAS